MTFFAPSMRTSLVRSATAIALIAGLAWAAFGSGEAQAQAFNVHKFECTSEPFGVKVDVRGLGNTNVCIVGSVEVDANCACVNNGGNCPVDAKKQATTVEAQNSETLEPKNGRVVTTSTLPIALNDGTCGLGDNPLTTCPSGQTPRLISFETAGADFTLCTTDAPAGADCSCEGQQILAETTCGPTSDIVFAGRRGSCAALFQ